MDQKIGKEILHDPLKPTVNLEIFPIGLIFAKLCKSEVF